MYDYILTLNWNCTIYPSKMEIWQKYKKVAKSAKARTHRKKGHFQWIIIMIKTTDVEVRHHIGEEGLTQISESLL